MHRLWLLFFLEERIERSHLAETTFLERPKTVPTTDLADGPDGTRVGVLGIRRERGGSILVDSFKGMKILAGRRSTTKGVDTLREFRGGSGGATDFCMPVANLENRGNAGHWCANVALRFLVDVERFCNAGDRREAWRVGVDFGHVGDGGCGMRRLEWSMRFRGHLSERHAIVGALVVLVEDGETVTWRRRWSGSGRYKRANCATVVSAVALAQTVRLSKEWHSGLQRRVFELVLERLMQINKIHVQTIPSWDGIVRFDVWLPGAPSMTFERSAPWCTIHCATAIGGFR